ncbi:response regulator [Methanocalculus sp.]|uniref:response regulator n=1 Tax=Methanocalculus sp. TaxID=2004547 RepID=UPI00272927EC|nr:response regulator [Methanocalculus sp.]MDO8841453.1 response regulator [Methanocalculus sp.]
MKTVMVVDDDQSILMVMEELLNDIGYSAVTVSNGYEAFDAIKERKPDLILLDLKMTPIDGWQVLEHLRKDGVSDIPVMLFTAKYILEEEIVPYKDDIILVLQKPVTLDELKNVLQEYFNGNILPEVKEISGNRHCDSIRGIGCAVRFI